MASRIIRWGAVVLVVAGLVLLPALVFVRPYLGAVFGYSCGSPATSLATLRSVSDLKSRLNAARGSPRLVLLVSPT
jgi:hypothetical protein